MQQFFNNLLTGIGITDVIDILLVAFVAYKVIGFIRESRAEQLVKGLLFLVGATLLSETFNLYALNWILKATMTLGAVALVIVFQPELRRGLEQMGRSKIVKPYFGGLDNKKAKKISGEFVKALEELSSKQTGALITIERQTSLTDICETGTRINADISAELLGNIFYEGAPLHDGAVIVKDDKIYAAACVLPLTENKSLPNELGTRHRAGIGITEKSDAVTIIVSEETGIISMARDGKLERYLEIKAVEKILLNIYLGEDTAEIIPKVKRAIYRRGKNVRK